MTQKALVNGATLAFDVRGSGPPLVLIVGYHLHLSAWPAEFLEGLAERFTRSCLTTAGQVSATSQRPG